MPVSFVFIFVVVWCSFGIISPVLTLSHQSLLFIVFFVLFYFGYSDQEMLTECHEVGCKSSGGYLKVIVDHLLRASEGKVWLKIMAISCAQRRMGLPGVRVSDVERSETPSEKKKLPMRYPEVLQDDVWKN